jgi:hypothetical protein
MTKREKRLRTNAEATERWMRKLFRAANELQKLERERKRLYKLLGAPLADAREMKNLPPAPAHHVAENRSATANVPAPIEHKASAEPLAGHLDDGLDIPHDLLVRNRKLQAMADPKTKEKKAERRAIEKEKRDADLRGKTRRMPLTGKAALDAIRESR